MQKLITENTSPSTVYRTPQAPDSIIYASPSGGNPLQRALKYMEPKHWALAQSFSSKNYHSPK
jgi:hypothetical protein